MSGSVSGSTSIERDIYRQKRSFARAICDALIRKDKDSLVDQLYKILWKKFEIQDICSLETGDGKSPIRYAITEAGEDTSMLNELKKRGKVNFDIKLGPEKMTPLHLAVRVQNKVVLKYLIKHGNVRINGTDCERQTALHCAVRSKSVEMCSILIDAGVNLEKTDKDHQTALHVALGPLISSAKEKLELLCKKGACPNSKDKDGNTALHLLAKRKPDEFLAKLAIIMKQKPAIGALNNNNQTPLDLYLDHTDNDPEEITLVKDKLWAASGRTVSAPQILVMGLHSDGDALSTANMHSPGSSRRRNTTLSVKKRISRLSLAGKNMIRRFSETQQHRTSVAASSLQQVDEDGSDSFDLESEFPVDEEERKKVVAAFVLSVQAQQEDDEEDMPISEYGSDISGSETDNSSDVYHGYMTSDDDAGDCDSFYSQSTSSRRNSPLTLETFSHEQVEAVSTDPSSLPPTIPLDKISDHCEERDKLLAIDPDDRRNAKRMVYSASLPNLACMNKQGQSKRRSCSSIDGFNRLTTSNFVFNRNTFESPEQERHKGKNESSSSSVSGSSPTSSTKKQGSVSDLSVKDISDETTPTFELPSSNEELNATPISASSEEVELVAAEEQHGQVLVLEKASTATLIAPVKLSSCNTLTEFNCQYLEAEETLGVEDPLFSKLNSMSEEDCITYLTACSSSNINGLKDGRTGESVMHVAARRGLVKLTCFLMAKDVDMDAVDKRGWTSLHVAAEFGNLAVLKMLFTSEATQEAITPEHETVLSIASVNGQSAIVSFLLRERFISPSYLELSIHQLLKTRRSKEITQLYVRHINSRCQAGSVDIHMIVPLAAKQEHWSVLNFVLAQRTKRACLLDLNKRDSDGYCAVHYCCMHNNLSMLTKLADAGASLLRRRKYSTASANNETALSLAKQLGFTDIVKYINKSAVRKVSSNSLKPPSFSRKR